MAKSLYAFGLVAILLFVGGFPSLMKAEENRIQRDLIIVVDDSVKMAEIDKDFSLKDALFGFVRNQGKQDRIALVRFGAQADLILPFTQILLENKIKIDKALGGIAYSETTANSALAIERSLYEFRNSGREGAEQIIVFVGLGSVRTGVAKRDEEQKAWLLKDLLESVSDKDIRIYAIAIGQDADMSLIHKMSHRSGGNYFRVYASAGLTQGFQRIQDELLKRTADRQKEAMIGQDTQDSEEGSAVQGEVLEGEKQKPAQQAPQDDDSFRGKPSLDAEQAAISPPSVAGETSMGSGSGLSALSFWMKIVAALVALAALAVVAWLFLRFRGKGAGGGGMPVAMLKDLSGDADVPVYTLGDKPVVLGRKRGTDTRRCDYLVIRKETVGRRHAMIEYREDRKFWIHDESSLNGTYVNGRRVDEIALHNGDHILLHRSEFEFIVTREIRELAPTPQKQKQEAVFDPTASSVDVTEGYK